MRNNRLAFSVIWFAAALSVAPCLAEDGLGQVEMFFSALVWYLGKHPDRAERLLATSRAAIETQAPDGKMH